jgi:hypothetical protein
MTVRHAADHTSAARAPPAQPGHVGAGAGLVDEHQPCRVKRGLIFSPALARVGHVGAFLLRGVQDFFKADPVPGKKAPDPATTGADVLRPQPLAHFIQGQVRLLTDQRQQQPGMLFQSRLAAPAPCRRRTPALLPALHPSDRRAGADRKSLPRRPARGPLRDGFDNTLTQILRTRLGHRSSPISDAARITHPNRFENPLRFNHAETCSSLNDATEFNLGEMSVEARRGQVQPLFPRAARCGSAIAGAGPSLFRDPA